ncbi:alpha-crystallin B chain-like [Saccostrea echinata]|uniref:alpha-crystallin B chain-like n=1 Tax=Saccostrea echinata TaxID=191078 RepID=UPI002A83F7C6|nr:alpha-crystallin B chain-like [Saccostrea echinata]
MSLAIISRVCPRVSRGVQALACRGFADRNIPVHQHSAKDHQRTSLEPWNDFVLPSRILPESFANRFRDVEKMMRDMENYLEHKYLSFPARGEESKVEISDKKLKIKLNVHQFKPEEINVKIQDNKLTITGKHEKKSEEGHSYFAQEFTQQYTIPQGIDSDSIISTFSDEGVLVIQGKVKGGGSKEIPIDRK